MKTLSLWITDTTPSHSISSSSSGKEQFFSYAASYSSGWSSSSTSSANLDSRLISERLKNQLFENPSKPSVQREAVFVYTDIASAEILWAVDPTAMATATELHNHVLRLALAKYSVTSGSIDKAELNL